jgi:hypothetical protein
VEKPDKKNDLDKYLKSTLEHMISAGQGIKEFSEFTLEHLGEVVRPYLYAFLDETHKGAIKIKGITTTTSRKILGHRVDEGEREEIVRKTAYLLAERRNFIGGDAEKDWYQAEEIVDQQLGEELGLVEKSYNTLEHLSLDLKTKLKTLELDAQKWVQERKNRAA